MEELLVNYDDFVKALTSISNLIENSLEIQKEITETNENLKSKWIGKSSAAFFKESENILNTFSDYIEGLGILGEDLQVALESFSEADSKSAENTLKMLEDVTVQK